MPENNTIAQAVAEALAEGRTTVNQEVLTAAEGRQSGDGRVGVALRQNLNPTVGTEGRAADILTAVAEAGLLAATFRPTVVRDLTTGEPIDVLSDSQRKVLTAAAQGYSYTETADLLHLSVSTVKGHVGAYYKKLGVHAVPEAVIAAIRCGALPLSTLTGDTSNDPVATPVRPQRSERVRCSTGGCRKRTAHESGQCPDHRS